MQKRVSFPEISGIFLNFGNRLLDFFYSLTIFIYFLENVHTEGYKILAVVPNSAKKFFPKSQEFFKLNFYHFKQLEFDNILSQSSEIS